jgi:hypothetical protein
MKDIPVWMNKEHPTVPHLPAAHYLLRAGLWPRTKHSGYLLRNTNCTFKCDMSLQWRWVSWCDKCGVWFWKLKREVSWLWIGILWYICIKGFVYRYLVQNVGNINRWAIILSCLYDQGYLLTAVEKQCWRICSFQVPGDAIGFRLNEGNPGRHNFFPSAHHLQGYWLQAVEGHWGISPHITRRPCIKGEFCMNLNVVPKFRNRGLYWMTLHI